MNRSGITTILVVFLLAMISMFVVVTWQTRLLLGVRRNQSVSDVLGATYRAESEINDIIARFVNFPNYVPPYGLSEMWLGNGRRLTINGSSEADVQSLLVSAEWPNAETKIELSRQVVANNEAIVNDAEIVFSLDCTESMGEAACPGCDQTRMEKLKQAVMLFLDTLAGKVGHEKVRVGISVFALKSDWLYTAYDGAGNPLAGSLAVSPENALTIPEIKAAVENGFRDGGSRGDIAVTASPACIKMLSYTSIGTGLAFVHDYLRPRKEFGKKQIEILVTDGLPNQRTPYANCPQSVFCPGDGSFCPGGSSRLLLGENWNCPVGSGTASCEPHARDFLRCTLASSNSTWYPEAGGEVLGLLALVGEPTSTPVPVSTPKPSPTGIPTLSVSPTSTPGPTPLPLPTPTPLPEYCNLSVSPMSGIWHRPGTFVYTNRSSSAMTIDWRLGCTTATCPLLGESGVDTLLPGESRERGWGRICARWALNLTPRNCPQRGFVAERENCPTSTPRPTSVPTATPTSLPVRIPVSGVRGVRDPEVDLYSVTVIDDPSPQVVSIFQTHSTQYYSSETAEQLSEILQDIFQEILESMTTIRIRRVVPGVAP